MRSSISQRVQKRRDALRAAGLRPVQIWVPDARRPGFAEEYRRQVAAAAAADRGDTELWGILDAALVDMFDESKG
ncbi:MAG: antitoxin MazE family protein [Devosia sp.]